MHITFLELRTVRLMIVAFLPHLLRRRVLLWCDNAAVVHILTNLTTRSPAMMTELPALFFLLDVHDISLHARWLASAANMWADAFSRMATPFDYSIRLTIFEAAQRLFRRHCTVDAFASGAAHLLPRFWAPAHLVGEEAVDAFAQQDRWVGECVWAHPPLRLLMQLAVFLRERPLLDTLVCAPHWPVQPWYRELLVLASAWVVYPPGSLQPVAPLTESVRGWSVVVFQIGPPAP